MKKCCLKVQNERLLGFYGTTTRRPGPGPTAETRPGRAGLSRARAGLGIDGTLQRLPEPAAGRTQTK